MTSNKVKPSVSWGVVKTSCFFTRIIYSIWVYTFVCRHWTESQPKIKVGQKETKTRGDSEGSSVYGGGLPRPHCLETNMNLFSKKYLQSHVHVHLQGEHEAVPHLQPPPWIPWLHWTSEASQAPFTPACSHMRQGSGSVLAANNWIKAELSCDSGPVLLSFFCR